MLLTWKGKASKRCHPKMMKDRRRAVSILKTPNGENYLSMLEKFMPSEFKKGLLQEDVSESVEQLTHTLMLVRSLVLGFLLLGALLAA